MQSIAKTIDFQSFDSIIRKLLQGLYRIRKFLSSFTFTQGFMFLEAGIRGNHQKLSIKNITKFTGKHLCRSLLINISAETSNFFKVTPTEAFSCGFCEIFKNTFLQNTCGRLLLRIGSSRAEVWSSLPMKMIFENTPWHTGISSIQ